MSDEPRTWKPFWWLVVFGFIASFALGFVALLLEMNCYRDTIGSPALSHFIFPLAGWVNHTKPGRYSTMPMILALAQFPLYGACVGISHKKWERGDWISVAVILVVHVAIYGLSVIY